MVWYWSVYQYPQLKFPLMALAQAYTCPNGTNTTLKNMVNNLYDPLLRIATKTKHLTKILHAYFMGYNVHWNGKSYWQIFSSLVALEVVVMTTSSATSDEKILDMTTYQFQCIWIFKKYLPPSCFLHATKDAIHDIGHKLTECHHDDISWHQAASDVGRGRLRNIHGNGCGSQSWK